VGGRKVLARPLRLRLACVAATGVVCLGWRDFPLAFIAATYSLGFAHYLLALRYSAGPLRQVADAPLQLLSLLGLALLGVALYQLDFPLFLYFGLHHALNEAYLRRGAGASPALPSAVNAPAAAFHALAYLVVLRWSPELAGIQPRWIWLGFAAATALFARALWPLRASIAARQLPALGAPEIAAVALVLLSLVVRVTFLHLVFYHFVLWAVLPVDRIRARGPAALGEYGALSVATLGLFLLISPLGPAPIRIGTARFTELFLVASYLHITLSFALSDAHPRWAVRWFRGSAVRAVSAAAPASG
jgi:hypothetical protein